MMIQQNADTFAAILSVFQVGSFRLAEAELAALRLSVAVVEHHIEDKAKAKIESYNKSAVQLDAIRPSSWDAFNYVSRVSHLVYATSLLDTFLTDTTQFLLMLFPSSIGKEFRISISDVIENRSRSALLTAAASRKARELSYATFLDRITDLRRRFGLVFELDERDVEALRHFSALRNVAVHDQGFLNLSFAENGTVHCEQRVCSRHPTAVSIDDVRAAIHTYQRVVREISVAILRQVIKEPDHEGANRLIELLPQDELGPLGGPQNPV
jgi:hypothetical protein